MKKKVYEFKNGIKLEVKDNESLFEAFYRLFCWDCEKSPYCHNACSEFSDTCENIDDVLDMMEELGVESL